LNTLSVKKRGLYCFLSGMCVLFFPVTICNERTERNISCVIIME
jgi:hypothetical protein